MITIVIPALNEENAIKQTIEAVRSVLSSAAIEHEILVIDDGSTDKTYEAAAATGATVIRHPHNAGYGRSLKAGICAAKYDTIGIIDADLTYPEWALPQLYAEFSRGFDMVVGARTGENYLESMLKRPLRAILQWLVEFTAGRPVPDVNSGLRIFRRSTIISHLDHLCDTFSFTTSATLAYMMTGRFVLYVPIEYKSRVGTTKVRLFRDSLRTLQYIVQSINYYNPLKLFLVMSLLTVALSLPILIVWSLTQWTPLLLLGVGEILVSTIILGLGLVADMLRQSRLGTNAGAVGSKEQALEEARLKYLPDNFRAVQMNVSLMAPEFVQAQEDRKASSSQFVAAPQHFSPSPTRS